MLRTEPPPILENTDLQTIANQEDLSSNEYSDEDQCEQTIAENEAKDEKKKEQLVSVAEDKH